MVEKTEVSLIKFVVGYLLFSSALGTVIIDYSIVLGLLLGSLGIWILKKSFYKIEISAEEAKKHISLAYGSGLILFLSLAVGILLYIWYGQEPASFMFSISGMAFIFFVIFKIEENIGSNTQQSEA